MITLLDGNAKTLVHFPSGVAVCSAAVCPDPACQAPSPDSTCVLGLSGARDGAGNAEGKCLGSVAVSLGECYCACADAQACPHLDELRARLASLTPAPASDAGAAVQAALNDALARRTP